MNTRNAILILAVCFLLCACHGVAPGPIIGGIAGGVAVLDQLLAGGIIDPIQHHQLATALTDVGRGATEALTLARQAVDVGVQAKAAVASAKEGTLSPEQTAGVALGVSTLISTAHNAYRNYTRKQALAAPAVA